MTLQSFSSRISSCLLLIIYSYVCALGHVCCCLSCSADASGTRSYPMELSVAQFQDLLASFTDLASQLDAA